MPPKRVATAAASKAVASAAAPKGWQALYNAVLGMRQKVATPVDVIGCDRLCDSTNPEDARFQTLVALMLSAQTRDYFTAQAVAELQSTPQGLTVKSIAAMTEAQIVERIKGVGMYNGKAKHLRATAEKILTEFDGKVPNTIDALLTLPGVGPKMAHLFMQCADGKNTGIGVDVHVHRIVQRWKWVPAKVKTPEDSRVALEAWLPPKHWPEINEILVGFGQSICTPRLPKCHLCTARDLCPNAFVENPAAKKLLAEATKAAPQGSATKKPQSADAALRGDESAEDLLALCGGSSQELLERGWLQRALPPIKVPPLVLERRASMTASTKGDDGEGRSPRGKAHRTERGAGSKAAAVVNTSDAASAMIADDHRCQWKLADIEDVGADAMRAVPKPKAQPLGKSKYFH